MTEKTKRYTFTISEEMLAWLEERRQALGAATLSEAVRQIIRDDMERERAARGKRP